MPATDPVTPSFPIPVRASPSAPPPTRPVVAADALQAALRGHLGDRSVRLAELETVPLPSDGFSGNQLFRVHLAWTGGHTAARSGEVAWVVKRWRPGGHGERLLGIDRPHEWLGWQRGLLRPASMPAGVSTPIVGAWRDPGGWGAWIAMEDVSPALDRYSRAARLSPTEAVARAQLVLDRMARLHAWWERPAARARLEACRWLVPTERFLWCEAASYAAALGRAPAAEAAAEAAGGAPTDDLRADLTAFLDWLPARDRALFTELLCHREPLAAALGAFPRTLLHGDLDDRNVGLHLPGDPAGAGGAVDAEREAETEAELLLIDWEWMGFGTPALDVAHLWAAFPAVCDPSQPLPSAVFSDELPTFYFERYRAYGGALLDARAWRQACALAYLGLGLGQVPFFGAMVRQDVRPVVAVLARQLDRMIETAWSLRWASGDVC